MRPRLLLGPAVALAMAGLVVGAPSAAAAPVAAAPCSGASGVTVVVDFNELNDDLSAGCDGDGGRAADNFEDAGFRLTYASREQGFVCRVSGLPAEDPCVNAPPADRYWSLWWSDGRSGTWTFSSLGVGSLEVPDGGYVAFSWHEGSGKASPPDVSPTPRRSQPSPSGGSTTDGGGPGPAPSSGATGSGKPSGGRGGTGDSSERPSAQPSASASASPSASSSASASGSASPTAIASGTERPSSSPSRSATTSPPAIGEVTSGPPQSDVANADDDGLPRWPLAIGAGLVLGGAAAVPLLRRRAG